MRAIIIGASGLIGSGLEPVARGKGYEVIGTHASRPRAGLVPFDATAQPLGELVPDLQASDEVFLLSSRIDQNWVFEHPDESRRINVDGMIACIDAALASGAHLVFMSTEAVFGHGRESGCDEEAVPAPLSLYARQKVEVETYLRRQPGRWCIARTGSTVGWDDDLRCAVSSTYRTLLLPGASMAYDNLFTVTDVNDIAAGLLEVAQRGYCGIVHLAANPPVIRTDLADWIMEDSRYRSAMGYARVPFSSIRYREPRASQAWLKSDRAPLELGLRFAPPRVTIARKVALLDQRRERELPA